MSRSLSNENLARFRDLNPMAPTPNEPKDNPFEERLAARAAASQKWSRGRIPADPWPNYTEPSL